MIYANDGRNIYQVTRTGRVTVLATTAILLNNHRRGPGGLGDRGESDDRSGHDDHGSR
jgi:hypothetical protein